MIFNLLIRALIQVVIFTADLQFAVGELKMLKQDRKSEVGFRNPVSIVGVPNNTSEIARAWAYKTAQKICKFHMLFFFF